MRSDFWKPAEEGWSGPALSPPPPATAFAQRFSSLDSDAGALFETLKRVFKVVIVCALVLAILGPDRSRLAAAAEASAQSVIAALQGRPPTSESSRQARPHTPR